MAKFSPQVKDEGRDDGMREKMIAVNRFTAIIFSRMPSSRPSSFTWGENLAIFGVPNQSVVA